MVLGNDDGKSKQWLHSPESLLNGKVTYTVKFMGKAEVAEPRGMAMVKMALKKLSFSRQIKRSEGTKPPKVELGISIHSVSISDPKTKETFHDIGLHRISFCADDKEDKRLFAFIAKLDDKRHYCYGLDSVHQANDITLTIGQAFELAYQKFMKDHPSTANPKKITEMSRRIHQLESENNELRMRIAELESGQRRVQNGDGFNTSSPPRVDSKPPTTASSVPFAAQNIAIPRRSTPAVVPVTSPRQEAIMDHPCTVFDSASRTSLSSSILTVPNTQGDSTLITLNSNSYESPQLLKETTPAEDVYAAVSRAANSTNSGRNLSDIAHDPNVSSVSRSVRKFRNSLQRNMRKTIASEDRMKKTLSSIFPTKIISKKLKRTKPNEGDRKFALLDDSPASTCSSPRSSAYANLDDVITTLQKMMDKDDVSTKGSLPSIPDNFIGEKLATYHDTEQQNYDTLPRRAPMLAETRGQKYSKTVSGSSLKNLPVPLYQSNPKTNILIHAESLNSNDDASSLSTTTTDSSSKECVYVLQPSRSVSNDLMTAMVGSKQSQHLLKPNSERIQSSNTYIKPNPQTQFQSAKMRKQNFSPMSNWPGTNIDSTLRQLGGEEGYMVLSGRQQVRDILANTTVSSTSKMDEGVCVDSTYDNVNRLMEAVRSAAARDAARDGGEVSKVLTTPATVAPFTKSARQVRDRTSQIDHFRPTTSYDERRGNELQVNSNQSRIRIPSTTSLATDFSNSDAMSFCSFYDPLHVGGRVVPSPSRPTMEPFSVGRNLPTSSSLIHTQPFYPPTVTSSHPFSFGRSMQVSQETAILHNHDQMSPPSSSLRLTSEDPFNMQPFVPQNTMGLLPQPPSRKTTTKPQGNLWPTDPFVTVQKTKTSRDLAELQSLSEASLSDTTQKIKKSNYHIVSHPLIRRKHRSKSGSSALKWSKKYFPNGKKKSSRTSLITKSGSPVLEEQSDRFNNAFGKGFVMSDEKLTLDAFDPLKY